MGFNGWSKLSVLLLASAALVGCNNTPTKDKAYITPKQGDPPVGMNQLNKGPFNGTGQPIGTANPNSGFPTLNSNPNSLQPTQGLNPSTSNSPFAPGGQQPPIGGPLPNFAPLPPNSGSNPSSFAPPSNPNLAPSVPNNQFGGRYTQPGALPQDSLQPPPGFRTP